MRPIARRLGLLALCFGTAAAANDSTAVMEAGGLRLTRDAPVAIVSERLSLSPEQVEVEYRFRAQGERQVQTLVAFPLPEFDFAWHGADVMGGPGDSVAGRVDFRVWIDGAEIAPNLEVRALRNGLDVTADLVSLGIDPGSLDYEAVTGRLATLDADDRARLRVLDLAEWFTPEEAVPRWTIKATYYWPQVFPSGRDLLVRHVYTPMPGAFFVTGPEEIGPADYCMTPSELAGLENRLGRAPNGMLLARNLRYVLSTGANWQGPIGRFHLVVDKLSPEAMVSLCFPGLERTSPTTFEAVRLDFEPERDLDLLFLEAPG